ncbi:hypothetical protein [uncultured Clostridium sp.]|uniref:hypothetical protein n=1 Tax=uncultured Clostridium sp. TaxID=59620 RepID=UPI00260AAEF5|nr:hypothetical protein [uncultured Clostridium sp.]
MSGDIIEGIVKELKVKFNLVSEVEEQYIKINEFDGYVKDSSTYNEMEELAIGICESIRMSWGDQIFDIDYEIIGQTGEHDLRFLIIL